MAPFHLLIIEDSKDDAELLVRFLQKQGFHFTYLIEENFSEVKILIDTVNFDIVLSDYNLNSYLGIDVIEYIKEIKRDLPVIIVSGEIGEEVAVDAMVKGAKDYIMKDNLSRLIPAITREFTELKNRKQLKIAQEELAYQCLEYEESERRYRLIFENAPIGICHYNNHGHIIASNKILAEIMNCSIPTILTKTIFNLLENKVIVKKFKASLKGKYGKYEGFLEHFMHTDDFDGDLSRQFSNTSKISSSLSPSSPPSSSSSLSPSTQSLLSSTSDSNSNHSQNINDRFVRIDFVPVKEKNNEMFGGLSIWRDITEQKTYEQQLQESVREKEVLLREINHRVKNNLQILSSFSMLQGQYVQDKRIKQMNLDFQGRINSILLIHESLYKTHNFVKISYNQYVEKLLNNLVNTYHNFPDQIQTVMDIENIDLDVSIASNCALLLNEILSNSLIHAFESKNSGTLTINMKNLPDEEVYLEVSDDGKGISAAINIRRPKSMGLTLINTFVKQLNGQMILDTTKGTKYTIIFPKVDKYQKKKK